VTEWYRGAWKAGNGHQATKPSYEEYKKRCDRLDLEEKVKEAQKKLDSILNTCQHNIYSDSPGDPFNTRTCYICGRTELI